MSDTFAPYGERHYGRAEELPFDDYGSRDEIRKMECAIRWMEHELFFLYAFLTSEGICSEACGYLREHEDDPVPFRIFR